MLFFFLFYDGLNYTIKFVHDIIQIMKIISISSIEELSRIINFREDNRVERGKGWEAVREIEIEVCTSWPESL